MRILTSVIFSLFCALLGAVAGRQITDYPTAGAEDPGNECNDWGVCINLPQ
uniref:PPAF-2-like Clip domain-containing protein n=1 Tax=Anopheles coluzzii TaxID=1518534 RepID=A0A6E8WCU4_ANOCL